MKKSIVIASVVFCVLLLGATAFLVLTAGKNNTSEEGKSSPSATQTKKEKTEKTEKTEIVKMEDSFITNVKSSSRYLKVNLSFEVKGEAGKKEIEENMPKIKDAVISILRDKTEAYLFADGSQDKLKEDILEVLHSKLEFEAIVGLYINEFIVQ